MAKGDLHLLIVGAGAMGCLFAAQLKRAGFQITLLEKAHEVVDSINTQGIFVEGVRGHYHVMVPATSDRAPHQPDLVIICVKSYNTREAGETLRPWLQPDAPILTLQNGVGNIEMLQDVFGEERVLGGVTAEGATVLGPGKIRHAGQGETIVGQGKATEDIVSVFEKAGFNIRAVDEIHPFIWGKLVINVGINALAAVTRLKNGRLPELKGTRSVMEALVSEAAAVLKAKNIALPYPDPVGRVVEVCRATGGNVASMLQDVLNKKRTEIDSINGAVVREGVALGIRTPVNSTLTALVQAIEQTYRESDLT
jgi:2-dehydropantoate 2-reductase